jgi:hypothetical protein
MFLIRHFIAPCSVILAVGSTAAVAAPAPAARHHKDISSVTAVAAARDRATAASFRAIEGEIQ